MIRKRFFIPVCMFFDLKYIGYRATAVNNDHNIFETPNILEYYNNLLPGKP